MNDGKMSEIDIHVFMLLLYCKALTILSSGGGSGGSVVLWDIH